MNYVNLKTTLLQQYEKYRYKGPEYPIYNLGYTSDILIWGPALWNIIHYIGENIHVDNNKFIDIYETIFINVICKSCKADLSEFKNFENFNSDFKVWAWTLHNTINKKLGKPEFDFNKLSISYKNIDLLSNFKILLEQFIIYDINNLSNTTDNIDSLYYLINQ
jgi:hypothetical protein